MVVLNCSLGVRRETCSSAVIMSRPNRSIQYGSRSRQHLAINFPTTGCSLMFPMEPTAGERVHEGKVRAITTSMFRLRTPSDS